MHNRTVRSFIMQEKERELRDAWAARHANAAAPYCTPRCRQDLPLIGLPSLGGISSLAHHCLFGPVLRLLYLLPSPMLI